MHYLILGNGRNERVFCPNLSGGEGVNFLGGGGGGEGGSTLVMPNLQLKKLLCVCEYVIDFSVRQLSNNVIDFSVRQLSNKTTSLHTYIHTDTIVTR